MAFEPELGQMLFSNTPWNPFEMVPMVHRGLEDLGEELEALGLTPNNPTDNTGAEFANETFAMRAYCWCDGTEAGHENGCPPNFEHFTSGFSAAWYKYLGRGSTQSGEVSRQEWRSIHADCLRSLGVEVKAQVLPPIEPGIGEGLS